MNNKDKIKLMIDDLYSDMQTDYIKGVNFLQPYCLRLQEIKKEYDKEVQNEEEKFR